MTAPAPYSAPYIAACRADLDAQMQSYRQLIGAASKASGASLTRIDGALAAFEPGFFNTHLVALDARFARRAPAADGPLAEVHLLAASLMAHGGILTCAPGSGYDPERSVLRIDRGERIALNADDFEALSQAFLAEIERLAG